MPSPRAWLICALQYVGGAAVVHINAASPITSCLAVEEAVVIHHAVDVVHGFHILDPVLAKEVHISAEQHKIVGANHCPHMVSCNVLVFFSTPHL